jgi:hypothetical protein
MHGEMVRKFFATYSRRTKGYTYTGKREVKERAHIPRFARCNRPASHALAVHYPCIFLREVSKTKGLFVCREPGLCAEK